MVSARALLLAATCCYAYLWLARAEDSSVETRSLDFPLKTQQEKDLVRHFRLKKQQQQNDKKNEQKNESTIGNEL